MSAAVKGATLPAWPGKWAWLYAPSWSSTAFALRTSVAALMSLLVAMWMELDSPQWAPLTVWVVATSTRGETLSKARWRLVGTAAGCIISVCAIACLPQQPALLIPSMALWVGGCSACATFFDGYRRYAFLVASFTGAIVSSAAFMAPQNVFEISLSRGTYIVLGILCETAVATLTSRNAEKVAFTNLVARLRGMTARVEDAIRDSAGRPLSIPQETDLLEDVMAANARVEFDVLELGPGHGRIVDHARATLSVLLMSLARARVGLAASELKDDMDAARGHMAAILHPRRGDRFRFSAHSPRQAAEAARVGARTATGILGAGLLWDVTAWDEGPRFFSYLTLVSGLLATRDLPAVAARDFLTGAMWSTAVACLFVCVVIPAVTAPECLAALLFCPMFVGGLAARDSRLGTHAMAFNMFLPVLIAPSNGGRTDEIAFFNGAMSFLAAIVYEKTILSTVLPFGAVSHLRRTDIWVQRRLRLLAKTSATQTIAQWLYENAASMVRSVRTCRGAPDDTLKHYLARHLQAMVLGLWIIELRDALQGASLSRQTAARLRVFLQRWSQQGEGSVGLARLTLADLQAHTHAQAHATPEIIRALRGIIDNAPLSRESIVE
ncbi:FUSC family protein [Nguyenibacter sp. L1]|uniref:FUSC family protein n=1 Tax=Nguyenibacter sp. L1 TaxID=3049350 RepID=UPI002B471005|nr:FUSC family protein [Nguyenibacter sp. L1]WRH89738.1 FUSC family protein [Nguyenibacter sp. L1]